MIRRRAAAVLSAGLLCAGMSACGQTSGKIAAYRIDVAEAVQAIAESSGSDQVQRISVSTITDEVSAWMLVDGQVSLWWYDENGTEHVEGDPMDYKSRPRIPTDTATMVQAVLDLPKCPNGSITAEALGSEVVRVGMDCRPYGTEDHVRHTYVGGEELAADSLDLTDPDRLSEAVARGLELLEGAPVTDIHVDLSAEPELRISVEEPIASLAGDNRPCALVLTLAYDTNGVPEQRLGCMSGGGWMPGQRNGPLPLDSDPFDAELALELYDRFDSATGIRYTTWSSDQPVYRVSLEESPFSREFDLDGRPLTNNS